MKTFSGGGMRRRVDLAASLVGHPEVLFLDEPTTGLDPQGRSDVWDTIRMLVSDGVTVLLTTQYLDEADQLADDIVVIDHGRVIATGTPDELKAKVGGQVLEVEPADRSRLGDVAAVLARWTGGEPVADPGGKQISAQVANAAVLPDRRPGRRAGRRVDAVGARHRSGLRPARGPRVPSQDVTAGTVTPDLVERAYAVARRIGFPVTPQDPGHGRGSACLPGTGRFLAMLAAGCRGGRIAELGTGAGIGAAWMSGAMPADCSLVTAELDPVRATAAAELLAGDSRVRVLTGDAAGLLASHGPFDLIFADCGIRDATAFGVLVGLLTPGGRIVMDDVTPVEALPADSPLREHDIKREFFAGASGLTWTEVVLPDLANSLLVGTRD